MGKFEQKFFEKHFATIECLEAFKKKINEWELCHNWEFGHNGGAVIIEFNHKSWHFVEDGTILDNKDNKPYKFIYLTKHKVDKEIERRENIN